MEPYDTDADTYSDTDSEANVSELLGVSDSISLRDSTSSVITESSEPEEDSHQVERQVFRLELYSDAVFSIIATISVLLVMEALKEEEIPDPRLIVLYFIAYVITFNIIVILYRKHNAIFNRITKITPMTSTLNIIHIVSRNDWKTCWQYHVTVRLT